MDGQQKGEEQQDQLKEQQKEKTTKKTEKYYSSSSIILYLERPPTGRFAGQIFSQKISPSISFDVLFFAPEG